MKIQRSSKFKGNHKQNEKATYTMGEICKWCNWQEINLKNILRAHTAVCKK